MEWSRMRGNSDWTLGKHSSLRTLWLDTEAGTPPTPGSGHCTKPVGVQGAYGQNHMI